MALQWLVSKVWNKGLRLYSVILLKVTVVSNCFKTASFFRVLYSSVRQCERLFKELKHSHRWGKGLFYRQGV